MPLTRDDIFNVIKQNAFFIKRRYLRTGNWKIPAHNNSQQIRDLTGFANHAEFTLSTENRTGAGGPAFVLVITQKGVLADTHWEFLIDELNELRALDTIPVPEAVLKKNQSNLAAFTGSSAVVGCSEVGFLTKASQAIDHSGDCCLHENFLSFDIAGVGNPSIVGSFADPLDKTFNHQTNFVWFENMPLYGPYHNLGKPDQMLFNTHDLLDDYGVCLLVPIYKDHTSQFKKQCKGVFDGGIVYESISDTCCAALTFKSDKVPRYLQVMALEPKAIAVINKHRNFQVDRLRDLEPRHHWNDIEIFAFTITTATFYLNKQLSRFRLPETGMNSWFSKGNPSLAVSRLLKDLKETTHLSEVDHVLRTFLSSKEGQALIKSDESFASAFRTIGRLIDTIYTYYPPAPPAASTESPSA